MTVLHGPCMAPARKKDILLVQGQKLKALPGLHTEPRRPAIPRGQIQQ